jgi:putative Mg2+ transporter-C (MgtC) family protein
MINLFDYQYDYRFVIDIIVKLLLAMLCGGIIGFQRQMHESAAGFRTHILVCIGAAVYMIISILISDNGKYDPGRIAAQVASGMGFLGAGTIIKQGSLVRGLTTAASLWGIAAVGMAIGMGGPATVVGVIATVFSYVALALLVPIEKKLVTSRHCEFIVKTATDHDIMLSITKKLESINFPTEGTRVSRNSAFNEISFEIKIGKESDINTIIDEIYKFEGVISVSCDGK